jgi:zinc finger SWIM domain-containing protein 3
VLQTLNCDFFCCGDDGSEKTYKVKVHGNHHGHFVKFSPSESRVSCSYKKFECAGILCCHALKILDINNIKSVPDEYILKRWTIDAKVLHITSNHSIHEDPKIQLSNHYSTLSRIFNQIVEREQHPKKHFLFLLKSLRNWQKI